MLVRLNFEKSGSDEDIRPHNGLAASVHPASGEGYDKRRRETPVISHQLEKPVPDFQVLLLGSFAVYRG
jgi:hypothetical protein